ncbi:MAG: LppY/LpqO family protein [bacterium]|nr:LppY/LpqO family protein [bacterium]
MMKRMLVVGVLAWSGVAAAAPALNSAQIEQLTGAKGKLDEKEGVFKVSVPRADLKVGAGGVHLTPPMGLTTWAAFTKSGEHTMMMGDMCLTEDQVNAVMSVALDNGLDVTALHNHFFWDSPKVMFMHIGGMGDEAKLAAAVGKVFAKIKDTAGGKGEVPKVDIDPAKTSLDPAKIEAVFGTKGELASGVYKVTIGRTTKMGGHAVGKTMGVNTWAAFAGSDEQAIVDGDFAMLESELQGVLKALRGANIDVVAIHQHMTGEQPRVMFLHYWGIGRTTDLANGLKAALAKTAK